MKSTKKSIEVGLKIFFVVYLIIMCYILFFKNFNILQVFSIRNYDRVLNLNPFETINRYCRAGYYFKPITILNVYGNIIIFIPFGIYLTMLVREKSFIFYVFITFITTISIEAIQYILAIGIADIDDVFLNLIGGIIGVITYKIFYKIFKDYKNTNKAILVLYITTTFLSLILYIYLDFIGFRIRLF